jgi:hypothetical protein
MTALSGPEAIVLARWSGRCPGCGHPIRRGDEIQLVADRWLHANCEQTRKRIEAHRG